MIILRSADKSISTRSLHELLCRAAMAISFCKLFRVVALRSGAVVDETAHERLAC
jgi:hypothetical protein